MNNTLTAISEKSQEVGDAIGIEIEAIYPPREATTGRTVVKKVERIAEANLVLMNVSAKELSGECVVNPGVLIEYGILIGRNELRKLSLLCNNQTDRARLSPIFHGHDIRSFRLDDEGRELTTAIKEILAEYLKRIVEEAQKYVTSTGTP